ncbi:MAG: FAD-binding protein [Clostridiales bacterium]|nr:FAD-binding protein [Clostridiales bacterium]
MDTEKTSNESMEFEPVDRSLFVGSVNDPENIKSKPMYSWEAPPEAVPEEQIAEILEADVVIIGGGIAGLAAGARCTQLGMSVIVVDKYKGLVAHGAHIACLDSPVMRKLGIKIDKQEFARRWMHTSGSRVNEDLLWLFINKSEEAVLWLLDLAKGEAELRLYGGYYKGPQFTEYAATHFFEKKEGSKYKTFGAFLFCEILQEVILEGGNRIIRNTRAEYLEKDQGRVTAFIAKGNDGKYRRFKGKKAVILATGDIGGDPEMLAKYCPLALKPKKNGYFPAGLNTGDGHKMAYWVGAAMEEPSWALSLHLISYAMYSFFFLHVNRRGERFMNEDTWSQAKAIRILMQPQWGDGDWAFSVFDSKWFDEIGERVHLAGGQFTEPLLAEYGQPWDESNGVREAIDAYIRKGACHVADTLEELAEKMEVPVDTFVTTVNRYNELYRLGTDLDYGKRSELLTSIDKPPYYALKFGPAILNVFGGALTDTKMRILDRELNPIPGLYAVGNVAGGLHGVDYPLLLNGNSHTRALVWAREAAAAIAEEC